MEPLTFKTYEERDSEFEKIQERVASGESVSLEEIRRVEEAKVEEVLPPEADEDASVAEFMPEGVPAEAKAEGEGGKSGADVKPDGKPVDKPAAESKRNWTIREEDIPQEGYYDVKTGKYRPFITQKDPGDLFKSYISAQKHIHRLENQLLPEEREKAAAETRGKYETTIKELQEKIRAYEESEKNSKQVQTPDDKAASGELKRVLEELKTVNPDDDNYDVLDHNKKLQGAILTLAQQLAEVESRKIEPSGREAQPQPLPEPVAQQPQPSGDEGLSKAEQWRRACELIDAFVASVDDPMLKTQKPFFALTQEMEGFNDALTEAYSGKKARDVPIQEWARLRERAMGAYLIGDEEILRKTEQFGVKEPKEYRTWLKLDQIDALRNGLYRDMTGNWAILKDSATGKPVNLGDMETAYSKYLDISGERIKRERELKSKSARSIADAIAKRDTGLVSLDTNALSDIGEGQSLTEEDAERILDSIDTEEAIKDSMHGNRKSLDTINQALKRLGREPLEVLAFRR